MSIKKVVLEIELPILQGTISKSMLPCGKPNCICKSKRPKLHGPYYRWTGMIDGRRTSRTLNEKTSKECERRIRNYRKLQKQIDRILKNALKNAPWNES